MRRGKRAWMPWTADGERRDGAERRRELAEALFLEIAQRVGDEAKETAMRWWFEEGKGLVGEVGKGKGKEREISARL